MSNLTYANSWFILYKNCCSFTDTTTATGMKTERDTYLSNNIAATLSLDDPVEKSIQALQVGHS
jgi:hypothetical protein